jgi:chromosome segregation ATPase
VNSQKERQAESVHENSSTLQSCYNTQTQELLQLLEKYSTLQKFLAEKETDIKQMTEELSYEKQSNEKLRSNGVNTAEHEDKLKVLSAENEALKADMGNNESRSNSKLRVQLEKLKTKLKTKEEEIESVKYI